MRLIKLVNDAVVQVILHRPVETYGRYGVPEFAVTSLRRLNISAEPDQENEFAILRREHVAK
jgi:hypothetical protein